MTDEKRNVFTTAWGETPEATALQAKIKFLYARYKRTKDMETLAELAELDPPAGDKAAGKVIAAVLLNKRPDKKVEEDEKCRWIDRVFNHFREQGHGVDESYAKIAEIFYPYGERDEPKPIDSIKTKHKRWLKRVKISEILSRSHSYPTA